MSKFGFWCQNLRKFWLQGQNLSKFGNLCQNYKFWVSKFVKILVFDVKICQNFGYKVKIW